MNRIALALLAISVVTLLCLMSPWSSDDALELDPDRAGQTSDENEGSETLNAVANSGLAAAGEETGGSVSRTATQAPPNSSPVASVAVHDRLVDEHGEAMSGVDLALRFGAMPKPPPIPEPWPGRELPAADLELQTAGDGAFRFSVPGDRGGWIQLVSDESLWVKGAPTFAASQTDLDLGQVKIRRAVVLSGRVTSTDGAPVARAHFSARSSAERRSLHRCWTNDRGEFRIGSLPGGNLRLSITREGFRRRSQSLTVAWGERKANLEFRISSGNSLRGIVLDDQAKPVAGALVAGTGRSRPATGGGHESGSGRTTTDSAGRFEVSGLGETPIKITVSAAGHADLIREEIAAVDETLSLQLRRNGSCSGRLVDENGEPVAGSLIRSFDAAPKKITKLSREVTRTRRTPTGWVQIQDQITDTDGRFALTDVVAGEVWLRFKGAHQRFVHGPFSLEPGEQLQELRVVVTRGARVAVTVTGTGGAPLAGALVSLGKVGAEMPKMRRSLWDAMSPGLRSDASRSLPEPIEGGAIARSAQNGSCELGGLVAGTFELRVSHPAWVSPEPRTIEVVADRVAEFAVEMFKGGSLSLRVVDSRGAPLAEQSFRLAPKSKVAALMKFPRLPRDTSQKGGVPEWLRRGREVSKGSQKGRTDAAGRALIKQLPVGEYEVWLETKSIGLAFLVGQPLGESMPCTIVTGTVVEVELQRPPTAALVGTVSDADGVVTNARLTLIAMEEANGKLRPIPFNRAKSSGSDRFGLYRFDGLHPGTYKLSTTINDAGMTIESVVRIIRGGEQREDVRISGGTVEVLVSVDGKPAPKVQISLAAEGSPEFSIFGGGRMVHAEANAEGVASFHPVPAGSWVVRAFGTNHLRIADLPFRVDGDAVVQRELKLTTGCQLKLECQLPTGAKKVQRLSVELTPEGGEPKIVRAYGSNPTVRQLAAGRYTLRVRRIPSESQAWSAPQQVVLRRGSSDPVRIVLP